MKLTKKQIGKIIKNTREDLRGEFVLIVEELGYFSPACANWAYHAGWTAAGDLVVTVFGKVQ